jgi:hypothetical protein
VEKAGTFCVREDATIVFWRADTKNAADLSVTSLDRSWKMTATWAAGNDRLQMLDVLTPQRKVTYLVDIGGTRSAITLINIPAVIRTDEMRLGWMIEKGCRAQAEALSRKKR